MKKEEEAQTCQKRCKGIAIKTGEKKRERELEEAGELEMETNREGVERKKSTSSKDERKQLID
ncbi:uncharacterized protein PGTG_09531 [Puccinia graminis f. sp. tritici CRL 75-36-700-3]|uniref:Uncharacterized protein n=1 Tax=Puccinia graminis f. sp. tritici (strain CRL 75-36-700-3 / race SCCL) TaxID=418459 RepID=E3KHP3_PUCGT|nr:uncharacterized protein PGTG_09531 [Puccinia graminis f. sp. tritici CRL 75-36-700-3]EFP83818.1 hypothetical protein PGTG_09531 [Puccinia graminis f. sp. tritici CRL 75-36-700-3]